MTRTFSHRSLSLLSRLRADRRGNVLLIFAIALPTLTCATGMAVDYTNAMRLDTRLTAAADAAVLAATSQALMSQSTAVARARGIAVFKAMAGTMSGLTLDYNNPAQFNLTVVDDTSNGALRRATLTFNGTSANAFAGFLGLKTLPVSGTVGSTAQTAPDINFYVMLDTSSSMALPTTTAGINWLKSKTIRNDGYQNPNGCAFACHQSNPDNPNVKDAAGNFIDYYQLAHDNNITLRIDAGKHAINDMLDSATKESAANNATYKFSISTFDRAYRSSEISPLSDDIATKKSKVGAIETVTIAMHADGYDRQTEHDGSLGKLMNIMPTSAGNGTRQPGDTAQAYVILITDGMRDEENWGRQMGAVIQDNCSAIKNRKIKIAVLYTTYQLESIDYDKWSHDNVTQLLPTLRPALEQCGSPGLLFEVSTDGSISAALNALFLRAIATSRLTQ